MGRRERPVDPAAGPVQLFASELRRLREAAGRPSYRVLAQRAHFAASTLAEAAKGERLPSLEVTLGYVRACGGNLAEWSARWSDMAAKLGAGVLSHEARAEPVCPYRGLATFQPGEARLFFGRAELVGRLLVQVERQPLVAVLGASGSGKSSLLRAGLLGGIEQNESLTARWRTMLMTPEAHPFEGLATQVAKLSGHERWSAAELAAEPAALHIAIGDTLAGCPAEAAALLVVDQFEELFTLCADQGERERFVAALLDAAVGDQRRTRVVLGIRADFLAHCTQHARLVAGLHGQAQLLVGPMSEDDLREVIVRPAAEAGLGLHPDLTAAVLADAAGQPGALPLVSHALLETWRRRGGPLLTLEDYRQTGGVRGAIAQTAERVFREFTPAEQRTARQIFLRLTALGEGTDDTRRPITRAELDGLAGPELTTAVLTRLATARLVVLGDDAIEVAHEALIRAWPRLHRWLTDDRTQLFVHRRIVRAARTWQELGRDTGALHRGVQLVSAQNWAADHGTELNRLETEFMEASRRQQAREAAAASRRAGLLKRLTAAMTALALLALTGGCVALRQRQDARDQQRAALARQLSLQARTLAVTDPALAGLLAIEAYDLDPTAETRGGLLSMAAVQPRIELNTGGPAVRQVVFSPDGSLLASAHADGTVRLWDAARRTRLATLTGHGGTALVVSFSADGKLLASAASDGTVIVWNVATRRQISRLNEAGLSTMAFSPDGTKIAVAAGNVVVLWDRRTGTPARTVLGKHETTVFSLGFSADSGRLISADWNREPIVWDVRTGKRRLKLPAPGATRPVFGTGAPDLLATVLGDRLQLWDLDRDPKAPVIELPRQPGPFRTSAPIGDRMIAIGHEDGAVTVWDLQRREVLARHLDRGRGEASSVALSPDGRLLASAGLGGTIILRDPAVSPFSGHQGPVIDVEVSPDGGQLATAGLDKTVRLWDARTGRPLAAPLQTHDGQPRAIAFSPDGTRLATLTRPHWITVWDLATRRPLDELSFWNDGPATDLAFDPTGQILATATLTRRLWQIHAAKVTPIPIAEEAAALTQSLTFSPDRRLLVSTHPAGGITLYDLIRRRQIGLIPTGQGAVQDVAISPDGKVIATAHDNRIIKLWDARTHRLIRTLSGHLASVQAITFSPDGRTLASAGKDKSIIMWEPATGRPTAVLTGHGEPIQALTYTPDGALVSGADDATVVRWSLDPQAARTQICRHTGRGLTDQERAAYLPTRPRHTPCHSSA